MLTRFVSLLQEALLGAYGAVTCEQPLCYASFVICGIAEIAVFLLFPRKNPFLVELHLTRLRRKRDQHLMEVVGMFACQ